jgi:predicted Zn-dependent protease
MKPNAPLQLVRKVTRVAAATIALTAIAALPGKVHAQSLIRDAEIEHVLRDYVDPIVSSAGLSPDAVKIFLVNDASMNAFVSGGQNIFIHTGLIMDLETPNQLKGVLAHETGHISGGHLARGPQAYENIQIPMLVTMLLGVAAIAAGAPDLGAGLLLGSQQVAQRQILAYSRTQESAADQAGFKFLTATGQSANGMLEVFDKFADQDILSGARQDPYIRSHPMSRERIATLSDMAQKSPFKDKKDSGGDQLAYDLMKAKLRGFIERGDVTLRRYPLSNKTMPARYARAVAYFRGADLERGLSEVNALIAEQPDNAYFYELKGQMLVESSRPKEGVEPYRKAVALAPKETLISASFGAALVATEDEALLPEAINVLRKSVQIESSNAMAWYSLATAYERKGDEARAQLATAERFFAVRKMREAVQFAGRSLPKLKEGSVEWQRARDIVNSGKDDAEEEIEQEEKQKKEEQNKRRPTGIQFEGRTNALAPRH